MLILAKVIVSIKRSKSIIIIIYYVLLAKMLFTGFIYLRSLKLEGLIMKVYMLFPKTREIVKDAQKDGKKIQSYSKGLVISQIKSQGSQEFRTYSYFGELKKIIRHDEMKHSNSTVNRFRIENGANTILKENTVTRFNDGLKVLFENWTANFSKNIEKSKQFSSEYKTFEGEAGKRKQTSYLFRYF